MAKLIQHRATPPTAFRFLDLPVEIRINVVNNLSRPSDIKALCRVSKEIWDIATPRLYNKVDLTCKRGQDIPADEEGLFLARISSLLSAPWNLRYIQKLKIGCCGPQTAMALDVLLPQLQENRLIEFDFRDDARNSFLRPEQLLRLWNRQKNLQNIQLSTYHIPFLRDFFGQSKFWFRSVTRLRLTSLYDVNSDMLLLPLEMLDISCLRSLTLSGEISSKIVYQLNRLFATRFFSRLTELQVESAVFENPLELSNSLASLNFLSFGLRNGPDGYAIESKGLVVPAGFPLRNLVWSGESPLNHPRIQSVLTKVKGLEHLEIECILGFCQRASHQTALARAIKMHDATIKTLLFHESMETEPLSFNDEFMRQILKCKHLEKLALPLPSYKPVSYYTNIIASLPRLRILRIYDRSGAHIHATESRSVELVEALQKFPRIEIFEFSNCSYPIRRQRSHFLVDKRQIRSEESIVFGVGIAERHNE